jgi:TolA-binding protein
MKRRSMAIWLAALAALAAWGLTARADPPAGGAEADDDEAPPYFSVPGTLPQGEDLLGMACWAAGKAEEAGPQIDPTKVLAQVIENMGKSEELLSQQRDAGQETVRTETKVIEDLSTLVEYLKQKQQKQQKQQQQKKQQSKGDSQKQAPGGQKPQSGQGQPKTSKGKNPAQKEQATHGNVDENGQKGDNPDLLPERWGILPENAPQQTKQEMLEMILPQYRDLLTRYFYALAQHKDETGGGK